MYKWPCGLATNRIAGKAVLKNLRWHNNQWASREVCQNMPNQYLDYQSQNDMETWAGKHGFSDLLFTIL